MVIVWDASTSADEDLKELKVTDNLIRANSGNCQAVAVVKKIHDRYCFYLDGNNIECEDEVKHLDATN